MTEGCPHKLIVAYIKEEFDITARTAATDDAQSQSTKLTLGQGRIKLNNHLSTLLFQIKSMPKETDKLVIRLPYMSHNEAQNNILRMVDGERSTRHVLSASNNFSITLP